MLETGDFDGGDRLSGLEFAGFSRQNTDFGALQTPGAGFRRKTSEFGGLRRTQKTHFSEFAVFSAFRTKNGKTSWSAWTLRGPMIGYGRAARRDLLRAQQQ